MKRIRVIPYNTASRSARDLSRALGGKRIRLNNSRYIQREDDLVINWGNSSYLTHGKKIINDPANVKLACNKLSTVTLLTEAGIKTVDWTTDPMGAYWWLVDEHTVYARKTLQGHSGSGIEVLGDVEGGVIIPQAKLYTKAITGKRREWRIHVCNGKVILTQKKKRRSGYNDNPEYSDTVRNHHTGWIYSLDCSEVPEQILTAAIDSVHALGLDFGAVDIITKLDEYWVLEVNTACGLSGESTLNAYTKALLEYT